MASGGFMNKTRVYEVARELGLDKREIVTKLASLGIPVRNYMSEIDPADADRVKRAIEKEKQQNVVTERIRPTVVRRRAVRRDDDGKEVPKEVAVAAPAPAAEKTTRRSAKTADVADRPAERADRPGVAKPAPVAAPTPVPAAVPTPLPARPQAAPAAAAAPSQAPAMRAPAPVAAVSAPTPVPVAAAAAAPASEPPSSASPSSRPGPLPFRERLAHSDLPPGVVARGNQIAASVGPLSEAARSRIVSEHAARVAQQAPAPRRRELVRSAIGPTGRQQQRGRPGRARKLAPGKKGLKPEITTPSAAKRVIRIEDNISLQTLASRMSLKATEVLTKLMQLGMMGMNINSSLDADTAGVLASEFGFEVENVAVSDDDMVNEARGQFDSAEGRELRAPVVTVMGHVDHGKTSLLDRIRRTNVAAGESGGITQHLGAYRVEHKKGPIVFLDTPGHAAFTAMRARGAEVTDIVILVVAADDGVMPQTKEAIHHARAAEVPIVVAINKMDKPDARPEVVMRDLATEGLQSEEWGGEAQFFKVSAQTGEGIDELLDGVLLQAEVLELYANPNVPATGVVLESYLDKGRGPVANVLVHDGTLTTGTVVVAGGAYGKIRAMNDDRGKPVAKAGPATPVEVLGLSEVPDTGDTFYAVTDIRAAQQLAERRKKVTPGKALGMPGAKTGLDALMEKMRDGEAEELKLVVKADVQGSMEALVKALSELSTDKVKVSCIHSGVGGITENDVMLASASHAIIIGFHVRPSGGASRIAKEEGVEIRSYSIIYEAIDEVRAAMVGLLKPVLNEVALGHAEVRQVFSIPRGTIAGCFVQDGKLTRSAKVRVVRDSVVVWEGSIRSLRRIKDDVREVAAGLECGVALEGFNDVKEQDVLEAFEMQEVSASL
jgi:translation initiation factor IF-2